MKKTQNLLLCAFAMTLACVVNLHAAEEGQKDGKATVRSAHGDVKYMDNGVWLPVKINMKFSSGTSIRTGHNGTADLSVNGLSSAVRMTNDTTLQISSMTYTGSMRDGDTSTMLNLQTGSVLGNVKKISANSRYEIQSPHGVAGIRGTDFRVEAIPTPDGKFIVTFNSITGVITVSAVINGQTVTHTLSTGMSWQIGESPKKVTEEVQQNYQTQINALVTTIETSIGNTTIVPGRNGNGNNNNGNGNGNGNSPNPANPTPPFNGGQPTGGTAPPAS